MTKISTLLHLFDHRGASIAEREKLLEENATLKRKNEQLTRLLKKMRAKQENVSVSAPETRH